MTKDEYLAGATIDTTADERALWAEYQNSEEYFDEIMELIELGCYDGPTGDA